MVPNASEDLPEPETPVNTTSASRGMSTATSFRLCSRAPRTRTKPSRAATVAWGGSRLVTSGSVLSAGAAPDVAGGVARVLRSQQHVLASDLGRLAGPAQRRGLAELHQLLHRLAAGQLQRRPVR